jgi:hypothetical protein
MSFLPPSPISWAYGLHIQYIYICSTCINDQRPFLCLRGRHTERSAATPQSGCPGAKDECWTWGQGGKDDDWREGPGPKERPGAQIWIWETGIQGQKMSVSKARGVKMLMGEGHRGKDACMWDQGCKDGYGRGVQGQKMSVYSKWGQDRGRKDEDGRGAPGVKDYWEARGTNIEMGDGNTGAKDECKRC